ncbi:FAD-binding oxidoreductase [Pseudomonas viridiflava]|uniref:NAD(P)/FAD-dependent oxidoreductase n=1 Tax=Pseudomonas syringae group TaxID=136849 RepID=UPI0015E41C68|nr:MULTISPECIES: FAD-binding oxidoreductase [Pseudomonas syringae group]MBA1228905.1 FAD-binding oxidoreductase [Pseudomonas viridiflava]MCF5709234.1 FAD-dependent oxidoreductase [Pseudomonas syringae]UXB95107.1 FAD dependent oxidoreductase [Pseudomonas syringae]UXB95112.1 FAD dependent oxidoreductase [Pseudomonas syringae]UXB95117.1 FAD dependent oxidoreductase [Pseudomonas syringae]
MPAPLTAIETSPELPTQADVVVIGGGIIGSFTAYYLAKRGLKVALIEKGRIGAEQSSRNWGWCRQQNRDARELPMATKALELWEQFGAETGEQTGFSRCGLLYLSNDEKEIAGWARWGEFARTVNVDTRMLTAQQAAEHGRATGKQWKGGVFAPSDGTADPSRAAPAVARAIMALGSTVHQGCAVRGIETEGGRVSAVVTEKGVIRTPVAVLAAGAWASSFCRQYGIRFPQATIRQTVLSVSAPSDEIPGALHTSGVSMTRRFDGSYTLAISGRGRVDPTPQLLGFAAQFLPMFQRRWRNLAPGGLDGIRAGHESWKRWSLDQPTPMEKMRILDPRADASAVALTYKRAQELVPALKGSSVNAAWAGYVDSTPDGVPGIGEVASLPGLVLASGFSGHGFGIGPGAGHLIADIVSGVTPIVDPRPYHPDRFKQSSWGKVADF